MRFIRVGVRTLAGVLALCALLSGCGNKGPLVHRDPAPAPTSTSAPASASTSLG